jgi:hypothetical protein
MTILNNCFMSIINQCYYNINNIFEYISGLTKDQFSSLIGDVDDIRTTKTRSIRTCIAVLLVKLRTSLGNALLSTLFNMTIAQVLCCSDNITYLNTKATVA